MLNIRRKSQLNNALKLIEKQEKTIKDQNALTKQLINSVFNLRDKLIKSEADNKRLMQDIVTQSQVINELQQSNGIIYDAMRYCCLDDNSITIITPNNIPEKLITEVNKLGPLPIKFKSDGSWSI